MPSPPLSKEELAIRQRLKDDLEHYSSKCLKIRTKSGTTLPLAFNKAQQFIHGKLEGQRRAKGFVRALILKGRQQGCSTYVGARFYHRVTHSKGLRVFILTHEDPATQNLFDMVSRYHDNCPALVRPQTGASNAKELMFPLLDSGYKVGTAGSQGVGRSATIQLLHGSEVAFWKFAEAHAAGILQTVPEEPGTEVILESTANGLGNFFHQKWRDAENGVGDFIPIFVPWFWQPEYSRPVDKGFVLTDEEVEYAEIHNVTREQIAWRRNKIAELKDPMLFKQEYPATAQEAFQTTGHDSFIKPEEIVRARKARCEGYGPLVMGVDPARFGDDRFSIAYRQGRKLMAVDSDTKLDVVAGANWVKREIDANRPDRCFIDVGGLGAGVYDILQSWGNPYARICVAVNFGGEPMEPVEILSDGSKKVGPRNRRAEMWKRSRDWLNEPGGADIPDSDSLHADACAPGYHYDINQRLLIESKEHMRARNVSSPDEWDAVVLTFAEPVTDMQLHYANDTFEVNDFDRSPVTGY
jgi:hypothetical protein